jgi:hypothetical protein
MKYLFLSWLWIHFSRTTQTTSKPSSSALDDLDSLLDGPSNKPKPNPVSKPVQQPAQQKKSNFDDLDDLLCMVFVIVFYFCERVLFLDWSEVVTWQSSLSKINFSYVEI